MNKNKKVPSIYFKKESGHNRLLQGGNILNLCDYSLVTNRQPKMSNLLCIEDTKSPSHVYLICNFLETNRALGSNTTISLGNLPNVDPFHDCYGSVAETYPLAEGLDAFRSSSVCRQRYVLTVGLVKQDRPSFHGGSSHITLCYKKKKNENLTRLCRGNVISIV